MTIPIPGSAGSAGVGFYTDGAISLNLGIFSVAGYPNDWFESKEYSSPKGKYFLLLGIALAADGQSTVAGIDKERPIYYRESATAYGKEYYNDDGSYTEYVDYVSRLPTVWVK